MADGLLGFDPEQLKALMAQFGATEQDKKDANKQAAFALGFGLLQGRKGQELANFGQSGANAMLYRQQLLSNIPRQKMDALGGGVAAMVLAEKMRLMKDQQDFLSKFRPQQAASGPASIAPPGPPPMGDAGGFSAPGVTPPAPPPAAAGPSDPFKQLMAQADQLQAFADQTGNQTAAAKAAQMREQALKWREEYTAPVVGMQGDKPTFFRPGKYGGMQTVPGIAPPPDVQVLSLGDRSQAIDKLRVKPGDSWKQGLSPDTQFTGGITMRGQNMTDARSREANAIAQDSKWTNDLERGIQINTVTGQSRPITEGGQPIGNKMETKAKQSAGKVMAIVNEAEKYLDSATGSYAGSMMDQGARVFGSSTAGATSIAQLQALEGALMLNQPRMEGPQSDKDTAIYKQMAGRIGDPTVPVEQKKAALEVIKNLNKQYAGSGASSFDAEFARMPSGTVFTAPDGTKRRKP